MEVRKWNWNIASGPWMSHHNNNNNNRTSIILTHPEFIPSPHATKMLNIQAIMWCGDNPLVQLIRLRSFAYDTTLRKSPFFLVSLLTLIRPWIAYWGFPPRENSWLYLVKWVGVFDLAGCLLGTGHAIIISISVLLLCKLILRATLPESYTSGVLKFLPQVKNIAQPPFFSSSGS